MSSERTEFGVKRSSCTCSMCRANCRVMPGFLIPSDLDRMIPPEADAFDWAEKNLLASPGAIAMRDGKVFRIPTLVPAVKPDGSCIHLTEEGLCDIHETAPFGCAFFDCNDPPENLGTYGLQAVMKSVGAYRMLWHYLHSIGKRQKGPEELRKKIPYSRKGGR